jgi:hypothetical protein
MGDGKAQGQAQSFMEAARAIGAGDDEAAFRAKLDVIERQKPKAAAEPPAEGQPETPNGKREPKGA